MLIDGKDVRHFTLKSLRDSVSLVTQDALLFSASVRENLLYARPDATEAMLWQALEHGQSAEFVEELPDQLDTVIGERGVKVSGGQRQRLALARAFLKDSKIVILDEATSAVDSESENLIHEAMERLMDGRTVFLIAHRLRSALTADMIVVLDKGKRGRGRNASELLRRKGTYAQLYHRADSRPHHGRLRLARRQLEHSPRSVTILRRHLRYRKPLLVQGEAFTVSTASDS